jgi:hypothetical protein
VIALLVLSGVVALWPWIVVAWNPADKLPNL